MSRTLIAILTTAFSSISLSTLFAQEHVTWERLFVITRNKNDNMVCYDARIKNAKLDSKEPIKVYWIIPKENNKVEELTRMERNRAYGFEIVQSYGSDSMDIQLKPLPRPMRIKKLGGKWVAVATVDSVQAILSAGYVMADTSGLVPNVHWVKLTGVDLKTHKEVSEKIIP